MFDTLECQWFLGFLGLPVQDKEIVNNHNENPKNLD